MGHKINTPVSIVRAGGQFTGRTGVTVTGEGMWNGGTSADRVVRMDDTGERLVFEGWMLVARVQTMPTACDTCEDVPALPDHETCRACLVRGGADECYACDGIVGSCADDCAGDCCEAERALDEDAAAYADR